MNTFITKAFVAIVLTFCFTESEAFSFAPPKIGGGFKIKLPGIIKLPDFKIPEFFTLPPPPKTAPPTTTTPTTTPPPPPPPTTIHPDDITIALCTQAMSECPWTADVLAQKIVERRQVDKTATFTGEGNSVGPTVNPNSIGNELERVQPTIGTGISIMGEKNLGGSSVPKQCYPFGQKHRSTRHYIINCISYLYDTTIREFGHRQNAMIGCFKCRNLCELGGAVRYL